MRPRRAPGPQLVAWAALVLSTLSLVASGTGAAGAAGTAGSAGNPARHGHRRVHHLRRPLSLPVQLVLPSCPPDTVDLGTWCLMSSPYQVLPSEQGQNNFFWASARCVDLGGWLPSATELIGAASRVKLESTLDDSPLVANVDQDPSNGLQDKREMSSTLVTTAAGSDAAGSEGVSATATGNPNLGQPNPTPQPADPRPQTLQYVTVYDNHNLGGFAGSQPVSQPENFRCAFEKIPGGAVRTAQ